MVLQVFHKFRAQDVKALGKPGLEGFQDGKIMRKAGWYHSRGGILASRADNVALFTREKEGIRQLLVYIRRNTGSRTLG